MTRVYVVFILLCAILLSGCLAHVSASNVAARLNYTAEKNGSPYRWHVVDLQGDSARVEQRLIGMPYNTVADATLQKEVLAVIRNAHSASNANKDPTLIDARLLSHTEEAIVEAWLISWGVRRSVYGVSMKPAPQGGVNFEVYLL